jgi:hypothetical protein
VVVLLFLGRVLEDSSRFFGTAVFIIGISLGITVVAALVSEAIKMIPGLLVS